jgi:succinate dehydrogenase / fumarate reductase cytochrome b subunit
MAAKTQQKKTSKSLPNRLGIGGWIYGGRYGIERYAYLFHRITGLALILYLFLHIYVVGERARGQEAWESIMERMETPLFEALEYLLLVAFLYHALNGLRLVLTELGYLIGKPTRPTYPFTTSIARQRPFMYFLMLAGAVLVVASALEFFHLY